MTVTTSIRKCFSKELASRRSRACRSCSPTNMRADMPEDVVYKMVKGIYENRDKLKQADPGCSPRCGDDFAACR